MKRLLIANRGEIALRYRYAAEELGLEALRIFAEDEAEDAPRAFHGGALAALKGKGAKAYLDHQQIVDLAQRENCDAVAVGYGFLSENPEFAQAIERAGMTFVGPSPDTLRRLGAKDQARALAAQADIPVAPGIDVVTDQDELRAFFDRRAGAPIMLKARAGGGGRGMRIVRTADALGEALESCRAEAKAAFGDDAVFAEAYIEQARHIEVQIAADAGGALTHLWERDCSLQRRHQKLIELAPAPGLLAATRQALLDAAERLGRAAGYRNLGTIEFLVEPSGAFFFLEANPRIQVEHTVTEQIIGVDLVSAQLRIAQGESLEAIGLTQNGAPPAPRGASVQLRINAEKIGADGSVRPASGRISRLGAPTGPGMRLDSAAFEGMKASPFYDSLLAKLIVTEPSGDYTALLSKARRALAALTLEGIDTGAPLLRALLQHPSVAANQLTTQLVESEISALLSAMETGKQAASDTATLAAADAPLAGEGKAVSAPTGSEPLTAPLSAMIREMQAAVGDEIAVGETVAILEALKMEHPLISPVAGRITAIAAHPGDVVEEGAPVLFVADVTERGEAKSEEAEIDLDLIRPDLERALKRNASVLDESRPNAMQKRKERGRWSARQNIAAFCDADSFVEYGALALPAQRGRMAKETLLEKGAGDGIVTGFGSVNGALFGAENSACAVAAVDYTVMAGTQGFMHHRKMDRWMHIAREGGQPLIIFPEGGGGRPNDYSGQDVSMVGGGLNVDTFAEFSALRGETPLISVVAGHCFAGNAYFPGASDIVIATRDSNIGMGGPAMIEGGGLGSFKPTEVGPAPELYSIGCVDLLASGEAEAIAWAKQAVGYFQGSVAEWRCADQRQLRHTVPENRRRAYDMRKIIELLADEGSVLELGAGHAPGLICALVRVEGMPFGLIANNPMHLGGALDPEGCDKGAGFLRLCDDHGFPVISLCDTPGFMVGPAIEMQGQTRRGVGLGVAGAKLSTPIFAIVTRKAYGLGAQAMVGGSFTVPRFAISWPTGEFGGMGLEGAVRLAMGKELAAIEDPEAREQAFQQAVDALYEMGKAENIASLIEIDAVIDPKDTRAWIASGMRSIAPKG